MSGRRPVPYANAIPQPTASPMVTAAGVTLLFAGLVTNWVVSIVGAVMALGGAVAWFRQVFPTEVVEEIPAPSRSVDGAAQRTEGSEAAAGGRAPGVATATTGGTRRVAPQRLMIPVEIHPYRVGIWGGLAGGAAMAVVACLWGVIREQSLWLPINLLAGVVLPGLEQTPVERLKELDAGWLLTAIVIHGIGSVFVGLLYTVALPMMPKRPILFGGLIAPVLWSGLVWASLGIVNPALERFISWPWFVGSQFAYGIGAGFVISRFNRVPTMQFMPLAERLRIERSSGAALLAAISLWLVGCDRSIPLTWKSPAAPADDTPAGFTRLWSTNCAGCHGADGRLGPARPMNDAVYLASVDDDGLRRIIGGGGGAGTMMPAFGSASGGPLSDSQVDAIVSGMRRAWGRSDAMPTRVPWAPARGGAGATAASDAVARPGADRDRGAALFARFCASCHEASGPPRADGDRLAGAVDAGSVTDPFFLRLVSDRALRSAIIFGRADLGMPGASGPYPGLDRAEALSAADVDALVSWLARRRQIDWPPRSVRQGGEP